MRVTPGRSGLILEIRRLVPAGQQWPVLLRDTSRLDPASFPESPTYPIAVRATRADNIDGDLTRRTMALAAGLPASFFVPDPSAGNVNVTDSGGRVAPSRAPRPQSGVDV